MLNETAVYHQARAAWAEAEPLYQRAIAIGEKTLGPDHPTSPPAQQPRRSLSGHRPLRRGRAPLPARHRHRARRPTAQSTPSVATRLNNLASLYQDTGRYAEAEPLFQRAIAIGEKTLGPDHPDLAIRLNNLAGLYRAPAATQAEPLFQRAIAPRHSLSGTGRYAEAEPLFQRAIAIGEKTLGPDHPNLATRLNNLAGLYQATGRYAEAEPLYQRAIAIGEKTLGPDHPDLATRLNNLASLYRATGRYAEAEPLFQRAIAIFEASLPPDHPNLATVRANYARLAGPSVAGPATRRSRPTEAAPRRKPLSRRCDRPRPPRPVPALVTGAGPPAPTRGGRSPRDPPGDLSAAMRSRRRRDHQPAPLAPAARYTPAAVRPSLPLGAPGWPRHLLQAPAVWPKIVNGASTA